MEKTRLAELTALRIGGQPPAIYWPRSVFELAALLRADDTVQRGGTFVKISDNVRVLGAGSSVVAGEHLDFSVILTKNLKEIYYSAGGITAQAGVELSSLARRAASLNLAGLEWIYGMPGTVGGAIVRNVSTWGHSFLNHVEWVNILGFDGKLMRLVITDPIICAAIPDSGVITAAGFRLSPSAKYPIWMRMNQSLARRAAEQPIGFVSCGKLRLLRVGQSRKVDGLYERDTSFLGEVNFDVATAAIVRLRSMKLLEDPIGVSVWGKS